MGRHENGMHGCQTELALQQKLSKIRKCCCEIKSPFQFISEVFFIFVSLRQRNTTLFIKR